MGAWMLTRGISLLIGGYPNEMQMLMMMKAGYVLSTSNFFFFYFVAIALMFLIGQPHSDQCFRERKKTSIMAAISESTTEKKRMGFKKQQKKTRDSTRIECRSLAAQTTHF